MRMALQYATFSEFNVLNFLIVFSGPKFVHDPPSRLPYIIVSTPETMVASLDDPH